MLTHEQIDAFQTDGAVLLKGVFTEYVEGIRQAIEENKANLAGVNEPITRTMAVPHSFRIT